MRTPKLDWTALKPLLENLKYGQGKSLTEISAYLSENYGKTVTAARLSQIFSGYKRQENEPEDPGGFDMKMQGDNVNAN